MLASLLLKVVGLETIKELVEGTTLDANDIWSRISNGTLNEEGLEQLLKDNGVNVTDDTQGASSKAEASEK
jgi:hypothetical protein